MRKLKVLHIIPNFGAGGAEKLVLNLLSRAKESYQVEMAAVSLYSPQNTIFEIEATKKDLKLYFLNKKRGFSIKTIFDLYAFLKHYKPDVIHTHLSAIRYAFVPAFLLKVPVKVHTIHNVAQKETDKIGILIQKIAFKFFKFTPVSLSFENYKTTQQVYGKRINSPIIYNGIPTQLFKQNNTKKSTNELVIIHIGRFMEQKNHQLLIDSFEEVVKLHRDVKLWLVGDGPLFNSIKQYVTQKKLEEKIRFLGNIIDIPGVLSRADIFVLSSDWEGIPLTILESMASGLPVITTNVGGVAELVENNRSGIIVPPKDKEALVTALLKLIENAELRKKMGEEGQRIARERFDISSCFDNYLKLYWEIICSNE
jgi:glycosyltransferase involved in cell wall biosynthesis